MNPWGSAQLLQMNDAKICLRRYHCRTDNGLGKQGQVSTLDIQTYNFFINADFDKIIGVHNLEPL